MWPSSPCGMTGQLQDAHFCVTNSWKELEINLNALSISARDRPAAIPIEVKSIDDTSNFDDFPDVDLKWRKQDCVAFRGTAFHDYFCSR